NLGFGAVEAQVFEAAEDPANDLTALEPPVTPEQLQPTAVLDALRNAELVIIEDTLAAAADVADSASRQATLYAVGSLGAVAIALIFAFFVFRATTIPLRKLTSAA